MDTHIFLFGRTPELAFLELKTFFPDAALVGGVAAVSHLELPIHPNLLLSRLGGTVKIARLSGEVTTCTPESLAGFIRDSEHRIIFGVSVYGNMPRVSRATLEQMKMLLEGAGKSARFVEARDGKSLSSVVVAKESVSELVVIAQDGKFIVGQTIAVQPFEDWGERDFGRPYADPQAGMLPPKVSRMVINIADRVRDLSRPLAEKSLLDPFCGMGTILAEALVMGWNVVGSDRDEVAVEKARANLRWLTQKPDAVPGVTYRLSVSDAVHVSDTMDKESIDAIVTEPFMGDTKIASRAPRLPTDDLKNTIKGLEKLYIGCLRDWAKVLKPRGVVMMALPRYAVNGKTYFVKKVIDMCEILGYTTVAGPIEYSRPQAVVRRSFYLFQKV